MKTLVRTGEAKALLVLATAGILVGVVYGFRAFIDVETAVAIGVIVVLHLDRAVRRIAG